ncbi:MAG TPA: hypothetical protein VFO65_11860 [Acidimicrobiales bacterium]|nr:hypothetical protein [Acidimicrobiales bacterium]
MGRPWWRRPRLWPTGTYTDWRWPPAPRGYRRFEWRLTPETDPTPDGYFWSHQFGIVGGQAGYAGLQTLGSEPTGKIAIFSVWQAEDAEGPEMAGPFGGEGTGFTARIAYRWQPGATYRLVVASPAPGTWEARVADEAAGEERLVGRIRVPAAWGGLRDASVMWTERYSGPLAGCADIRHASAVFSTPSADDGVAPLGRHNHLWQPPGCPGSAVQDVPGGVRQVMGAP